MPVTSSPVAVAIDFETSGYAAHMACAVGLARIEGGQVTACHYSLIRPPSSRVLFSEIHGLTWADLKSADDFATVWQKALPLLDGASCLLAHNASFDRRVLQAACRAARLETPRLPFLCTLKGARCSLPIPSKKLNDVCAHFGIPLEHHHAGSDARACAEIYLRLRAQGLSDARMRL
ncbi:MAG: 3'-5' exonuclease [Desulfovibrio sp.]|nr:3'-5' exonuclease [Desulfovibrio sp.]